MTASGFQPRFTITNAITAALTRIERTWRFLAAEGATNRLVYKVGESGW